MTNTNPAKPRFWHRKSFAILCVITLAISGGLTAILSTTKVSAADLVCDGSNILDKVAQTNPSAIAAIKKTASTLPYGSGILWKVEKAGKKPSYVFGTMHMSDPRLLDLDPQTETAFQASDILALEIADVLNPAKMKEKASGLVQYTAYGDGTDITTRLSDEEEAMVKELYSERGTVPWFLAKKLRPWALMGSLATPACETARKAVGKPFLDQMLAQRADKAGMKLVSLESVENQIKAMASLPEEMMIKTLVETVKISDQMDDVFETMIQLYEQGEIGTVWAMMKHLGADGLQDTRQKSDYTAFQEIIVDKRNIKMADGAAELIENGGGAFVAVGALHLPGENGVLSILAQRGYTVSAL